MCGIVGYVGLPDASVLSRMNARQVHRGPDDAGEYVDPDNAVGMAMRRLSIVDVEGGHQPMHDESGTLTITFNGEIFNAPELRHRLAAEGMTFRTAHSDTEVILRLYERDGEACAAQLNGMFAFVIYDRKRRLIYGARDPFGIKPLHMVRHARGIAWASELKSLFALPDFDAAIDPLAVKQYLGLQYIPGERTIYEHVRRVPPGSQFTYRVDAGDYRQESYYELPFADGNGDACPGPDAIRERFADAVGRWNMADVPVACALSGGIDSAAVVACLSRAGFPVRTYTVGFRSPTDSAVDERNAARQVAEMYGAEHHEIELDVDDLLREIPAMVSSLDEPYGGGLPSWYVFKHMAKDVKVAMTGTGGDELFSNYRKYSFLEERPGFSFASRMADERPRTAAFLSRLSSLLTSAKRPVWPVEEEESVRYRHRREDACLFWTHPFGITFPTAHGTGINERLYAGSDRELSAGRAALEALFNQYPGLSLRNRCAAVDLRAQLPDEFLLMTDRFSMAHSLEARTPFLDTEFVRFALGIPPQARLTTATPKRILKDAFRDWLPSGYTERRKTGFVLPTARWLRGPLRAQAMDLFDPAALRHDGFVREDFRDAFYRPFLEGHAQLAETVWTVFMFRQWQMEARSHG